MSEPVAIKPDPEAEGSSPLPADDDAFEDTGDLDLEFYDAVLPDGTKNPAHQMYLAKVPNYVWEAWSTIDDDSPIEIGKIRLIEDPARGKREMKLLLADMAKHQQMPKEYDLNIVDQDVKNTFVFTEGDLAGYKTKNKARQDAAAAGIPAHLLRSKVEKPAQNQRFGKRGKQEFFRKVIPKKTAISGRIAHEIGVNPIDNEETQYIFNLRAYELSKPKRKVGIMTREELSKTVINNGMSINTTVTANLVRGAAKTEKAKRMDQKTARMPENELFDKIFQCFREYKYWSLKALRARIPQPELYLRETVEKVANLHKSGTFANHWSLKPEHQGQATGTEAELAPEVNADLDSDEGEEYEDVLKMEDVQPTQ
ncbi:Transcription initiation factor TFIIF subunit beta [Pleurostoma richardsiae]|uniref:Transcription initiation factor IIF subunit beta n=1 Tax=Pleurostoma richardsiae TaxID=41990 RepID=A0AA38VKU5_9PEZI|nr:Transcription initiation factor TFIIF subunit beta [Pleurostoma richardsiae]